MTPSSLMLAALADAAVPGLRPVAVEEVVSRPGDRYRTGFVTDDHRRTWVVRIPRDVVAAADQDASFALLALLGPRVPFAVPSPAGFVQLKDGRTALVHPLLPGDGIDLVQVPSGPGLAAGIGRLIAAVHNVDRRLYEEAGVPSYEADVTRRRHLALLDRGAATRRVPSGLLSRWERMLDDVSLWRFAPTPLHGRIEGDRILVRFPTDEDAASGIVIGLLGWERACVGDPAEDFVELVRHCSPDTLDSVVEAYAVARTERPDAHIVERARLAGELRLLGDFVAAVTEGSRAAQTRTGEALQRLDAEVGDDDAPSRADEEPLFETVPVDFSPAPVAEALYSAGTAHATAEEDAPDATPAASSGPGGEAQGGSDAGDAVMVGPRDEPVPGLAGPEEAGLPVDATQPVPISPPTRALPQEAPARPTQD